MAAAFSARYWPASWKSTTRFTMKADSTAHSTTTMKMYKIVFLRRLSSLNIMHPLDVRIGKNYTAPENVNTGGETQIGTASHKNGASVETRTRDLLFTKQLLYRLSYAGVETKKIIAETGRLNNGWEPGLLRYLAHLVPWGFGMLLVPDQ